MLLFLTGPTGARLAFLLVEDFGAIFVEGARTAVGQWVASLEGKGCVRRMVGRAFRRARYPGVGLFACVVVAPGPSVSRASVVASR